MSKSDKKDPGYCGIEPFTTGENDPFFINQTCPNHDKPFDEAIAGEITSNSLRIAGQLGAGVLKGMAQGAYAVVAGPVYFAIGLIVGTVRYNNQIYRLRKNKRRRDDLG